MSSVIGTFLDVMLMHGRSAPGVIWAAAASTWSLIFAAPHIYWAAGGRAGLAGQKAAADAALQQTWFAAYNLAAAVLAVAGAVIAVALALRWGNSQIRRFLLIATAAAAVALLARGALGLTLLGHSLLQGTWDDQAPLILLAIEPWFLLGGLAYGGLTLQQRRRSAALAV